jgi:DNA-binding transcriptional regulator YiaG
MIHVSRSHIPVERKRRKPFPTSPKTLGDHIRAKRFEKGLSLVKAADLLGIWQVRLTRWELDRCAPSQTEWTDLVRLLDLNPALYPQNPTVE